MGLVVPSASGLRRGRKPASECKIWQGCAGPAAGPLGDGGRPRVDGRPEDGHAGGRSGPGSFRHSRPSAVMVSVDGSVSRIPIVDATRWAQLAIVLTASLVLWGSVKNEDAKGAVMSGAINDLMESVQKEAEARLQVLQRLWSAADAGKGLRAAGRRPAATPSYPRRRWPVAAGSVRAWASARPAGGRRREPKSATSRRPRTMPERRPARSRAPAAGAAAGGGAMGRPVAVIVLGPEGVEVKPVVDVTKVTLTALGVFAATAACR